MTIKPGDTVFILKDRLPSQMLKSVGDATTGVVTEVKITYTVQVGNKTLYFLPREVQEMQTETA